MAEAGQRKVDPHRQPARPKGTRQAFFIDLIQNFLRRHPQTERRADDRAGAGPANHINPLVNGLAETRFEFRQHSDGDDPAHPAAVNG